jgi:preprotein translocase subunit SecE
MAEEETKKKEAGEGAESEQDAESDSEGSPQAGTPGVASSALAPTDAKSAEESAGAPSRKLGAGAETAESEAAPVAGLAMGTKRFVYAAYMAGAIAVAFIVSKAGAAIWHRLGTWKPQLGEAKDEYLMPAAAVLGAAVAYYYWRRQQTREYVEQVADELSKVTWPSRKEVTNSTFVVIVATAFATVFFALMDQFWRYVTNLVYGF